MILTIELPQSSTPRTHIAASNAANYVAFELGKLPDTAWLDLQREGSLSGEVGASYVGMVKWTITAD